MKKILLASSECVPFIKTGGLADVAGALPKYFDKRKYDVRVILPNYSVIPEVYQQKMQPTKTLDQLYSLMETMLSDFQDIDNNMVEPAKLFLNIADWKDMTDFSFLDEEQRNAIEQFFGKFFKHIKLSIRYLFRCYNIRISGSLTHPY